VCVCLSVRDHLFGSARPIFTNFLCMLPMAVARSFSGGVVTLCTSGFMDDVIFAHKPRLFDVAAQLKCIAHAALGLAINCAVIPVTGQRTHGTTFRALEVTSQVATPGQSLRSMTALL